MKVKEYKLYCVSVSMAINPKSLHCCIAVISSVKDFRARQENEVTRNFSLHQPLGILKKWNLFCDMGDEEKKNSSFAKLSLKSM